MATNLNLHWNVNIIETWKLYVDKNMMGKSSYTQMSVFHCEVKTF